MGALRGGAPLAAVALAGAALLIAAPPTADMAAHAFRTGLLEREGLTVWNAHWYGGHHVLGYSLLFSPLAAVLGPRLLGVLAALAAVAVFATVARRPAAVWLFAAGVLANVAIGRMPFTLGIALGLGAWACAERGRRAPAALLAVAATWASPVAGVFLALAAAARWLGGRGMGRPAVAEATGAGRRALLVLAAPALAAGALLAGLFPESGVDRFVATAFWPMLAVSIAAAALVEPRHRAVRAGAWLGVALLVAAFLLPTPFGQNALRLPVLLGPPLLVVFARPGVPRAAVLLALLYLQWLPAVRAVAEAGRDPATAAAFHADARRFLEPRIAPGERVEVPLTLNHWEAAHLAPHVPLARGWERQLDIRANPLFYDGRPLTAGRYSEWLRERGVAWVALPAAPLDFSAQAERRLLERGVPALDLVHESARWRIWRVDPAGAAPVLASLRTDGFDLVRGPGTVVVAERWTRYWAVVRGDACVRRAGEWTAVTIRSPGPVAVRARFSAARAVGRGRRCG